MQLFFLTHHFKSQSLNNSSFGYRTISVHEALKTMNSKDYSSSQDGQKNEYPENSVEPAFSKRTSINQTFSLARNSKSLFIPDRK